MCEFFRFLFFIFMFFVAFFIKICLLSDVSVVSVFVVVIVINFSHCHLLLQNHRTKLGTKHPWVKVIQDSSKEGPALFQRGNKNKIAKIHWNTLKVPSQLQNHFCKFQLNLTQSIPGWMGLQVLQVKGCLFLEKENVIFSLNQCYGLIMSLWKLCKCLDWSELFLSRWAMWPIGLLCFFSRNYCNVCRHAIYAWPMFLYFKYI